MSSPVPPTPAWQTTALDGQVWGQPLVYGPRVYVATENDGVYALDAATGAVLWRASAGTPVPSGQLSCGDIGPTVGITSTPVIDPRTDQIYVVAANWDGAHVSRRLVGFNLITGGPDAPRVDDPPLVAPDLTKDLLQRGSLALDGSEIVIPYGGNDGDCGSYHGWHGAGNLYVATGNGDGSVSGSQESVLKLGPALNVLDSWTPSNWSAPDSTDKDLGAGEPLLLPGGYLFQTGKDSNGYLLRAGGLGTTSPPVAKLQVCGGAEAKGGSVYAAGIIYVACDSGLRAVYFNPAPATLSLTPGWTVTGQANGPPIVAGGLVWVAGYDNGTLYGLDPHSGAALHSFALGSFDHFASPSAAGGLLFAAGGNQVTAVTAARGRDHHRLRFPRLGAGTYLLFVTASDSSDDR